MFQEILPNHLVYSVIKGNYFTNTFHLNECDNKIDNLNQRQCNLLAKYRESSFRLLTGYLSYLIQKQIKDIYSRQFKRRMRSVRKLPGTQLHSHLRATV